MNSNIKSYIASSFMLACICIGGAASAKAAEISHRLISSAAKSVIIAKKHFDRKRYRKAISKSTTATTRNATLVVTCSNLSKSRYKDAKSSKLYYNFCAYGKSKIYFNRMLRSQVIMGLANFQLQRYSRTIKNLNVAVKAKSKNPAIYYFKGLAHYHLRDRAGLQQVIASLKSLGDYKYSTKLKNLIWTL